MLYKSVHVKVLYTEKKSSKASCTSRFSFALRSFAVTLSFFFLQQKAVAFKLNYVWLWQCDVFNLNSTAAIKNPIPKYCNITKDVKLKPFQTLNVDLYVSFFNLSRFILIYQNHSLGTQPIQCLDIQLFPFCVSPVCASEYHYRIRYTKREAMDIYTTFYLKG